MLAEVLMTVRGRTCKAGTMRFSGSLSEVKQCPLGLDRCLRELLFGSAAGLLEGCSRTCSHDGEKNTRGKWKKRGLIHLCSQIESALKQPRQEWHRVIGQGYRCIAFCQAEPMCLHFPAH